MNTTDELERLSRLHKDGTLNDKEFAQVKSKLLSPPDDALVRWEQTRREALGTAITLLFGLSSGALAFCGSLLTGEHIQFGGAGTKLFLIAAGAFILCLVVSVLVTITRLADFRTTVAVVRKREAGNDPDGLERLRCRARCLGSCTWFLFYVQIVTFFLGTVLMMFALWYLFYRKLFPY